MTVTFTETTVVDPLSVKLKFTSDASTPVTFRVFVMGLQATEFTSSDGAGEFLLHVADGQQPYVQVIDDAVSKADYAYPGQMTLFWYAVSGAVSYRIDEYVSSVWTERFSVIDQGQGAFTYLTRWLSDATAYQWRVMPIGENGNDGTALTYSFTTVRHPDVPSVSYAVDSGGNLTVSAA